MTTLIGNLIFDEVRRLDENAANGVLTLNGPAGERIDVSFREGIIETASTTARGRRLGDYLVKDEYATARDLDALEQVARRQKILFGEAVVRKGILTQAEVAAVVRRQAIDSLQDAFRHNFSIAGFKTNIRSYFAPARIKSHQLLLEWCRANAAGFEPPSNVCFAVSNGADLSLFQWAPQELFLLTELQCPTGFDDLFKKTELSQHDLKRMLGVLLELGVVKAEEPASAEQAAEGRALIKSSDFSFEHLIPLVSDALLHEKLEVANNQSSFTSEQFKTLKVQIKESQLATPPKVLTVSSPAAQDGKSLICLNLAFSFALDPGRRVIVVDCDLRKPTLADYLGVATEPGLLQYLGNGHLRPYCYLRRMQNLYFLTTGGSAPNPVEILSMNKMKQLIEQLKNDFDTVILDAPPYFPIADARVVTGLSDALIMVVRRGRTPCGSSDLAFKAIDRNKLLGVVFNDVQPMPFHTYYNFGNYEYGRNRQGQLHGADRGKGPKNYLNS